MKRLLSLLVLPLVVLLGACRDRPAETPRPAEATYLNLGANATYVGIDACKTCHAAQYETFVEAEMGRSFKPATLRNSAARFDDPAPVYDPYKDFYYLPFNEGEALFIMEYRLSGRDTVFKRIEQIDYIVGSGQHTNSHVMEENGYLYQMPLTWYAQDGRWDLPPKFDGGNNYRFDRPIPLECMTCHNAVPGFVEGSLNRFSSVPHGIDCERCHGPGSIHVREKQAGRVVDVTREVDYTIVNPRKLPVERQFDICQRCHTQGAAVYREGRSALDFRPGLRLADVENVFWPRYADSVRHFIMASHPDRLKMSRCFAGSHEQAGAYAPMTCTTCHNPHVGIETLGEDHYNRACRSCHTPDGDNLCAEQETVRAAKADNCVACHMPVSGSTDIPHVRITDHFIRTPQPAETQVLTSDEGGGRKVFVGLASLIDDAPTAQDIADGYLTYFEEFTNHPGFLDSAAVYLARAEQETSRQALARSLIRMWFLQEAYPSIIGFAPTLDEQAIEDPWTLYRIGEAFFQAGAAKEAIHYFGLAVDRAPDHLPFMNKLAAAYSQDGQHYRAFSLYDAVIAANPKFGLAYNNRGFKQVLFEDAAAAEADFLAALALDPDAVMPLGNLASLYYNTGREAEARPYVQRLLALDPTNPRYRQLWNLLN